MAKTKSTEIKAKEPVKIRTKELANGNKSLFLDIYLEGQRTKEYLKLYLIPETKPGAKLANENTMRVANTIKAQRILEIANGKAGIKTPSNKCKTPFVDWLHQYYEIKKETRAPKYAEAILSVIRHIEDYENERRKSFTLEEIDKAYLTGFFTHLDKAKIKVRASKKIVERKPLSANSKQLYSVLLTGALNAAVKDDYIEVNPMTKISKDDRPQKEETLRPYLTVEEVKTLKKCDAIPDIIKRAFLFSCCCGLRLGDIRSLTWGDLKTENGQVRAHIKMQKTRKPVSVSFSNAALSYLPERGVAKDGEKVFESLPTNWVIGYHLEKWEKAAGLKTHVTFHVARHTFATTSLTAGVDIYTTSSMLGHTSIRTTQIYAKTIDQKKDEAVNKVADLFED